MEDTQQKHEPLQLLEYTPEQLEKFTDDELVAIFKNYFTVTRPIQGVAVKNKVADIVGTSRSAASTKRKVPQDIMTTLAGILPKEQMETLAALAKAKAK